MIARTRPVRWTVLLTLLAVAIGCSDGTEQPQVLSQPASQESGSGERPLYSLHASCWNADAHDGMRVTAYGDDSPYTVRVWITVDPPPAPAYSEVTVEALPQGIQLAKDSAGVRFVLVTTTDYQSDSAAVVLFKDTDGDGFPDQGSRMEIATRADGHLVGGALDRETGAFYVLDLKNDEILRSADTDGDLVPNGTLEVFAGASILQVASIGPATVDGAALHSVNVVRPPLANDRRQQPFVVRITDTNEDGVAEQAEYVPPLPYAELLGVLRAGDAVVEVEHSAGTYRVDALAADGETVLETLASFSGDHGKTEVALSRALVADEYIAVYDVTAGEHRGGAIVYGTGTVIRSVKSRRRRLLGGGALTFLGDGITGSESVVSKLASADPDSPWLAASVSGHTDTTLTIVVPEYGITGLARAMFRITTASGDEQILSAQVKPD